jgi:predicted transcriptional regulator
MIDQFVERRFRDGKGSVDSFIAQIEHAKGYGGVDRLGKGAKECGIHFKMVPWHDNIVTAMLNLSSHTMWVIVNYRMTVAENDELLQPYRQGAISMTSRKKFILDFTRDVVNKNITNLLAMPKDTICPSVGVPSKLRGRIHVRILHRYRIPQHLK